MDDREIMLKRQQKIYFQISAAGHEALAGGRRAGASARLRLVLPLLSRSRPVPYTGHDSRDMLLQAVGAATDPSSGGRQMPTHWSSTELHMVSTSSSTATQLLHAVGSPRRADTSAGILRRPQKVEGDYRNFHDVTFQGDEVVLACIGEGSTSARRILGGDEYRFKPEAAGHFPGGRQWLRHQRAGRSEYAGRQHFEAGGEFPEFLFAEIDGTDAESCLRAVQAAAAHCRAGIGPAFVHGHCVRHYSHSLSDDDKLYRSAAERESDALRDPIARMQMRLLREGILTEAQITALEHEQDRIASQAADAASGAAAGDREHYPARLL